MKFTDTFKKTFSQRFADTREMTLMEYLAQCKTTR
jgi:hypothetical protein